MPPGADPDADADAEERADDATAAADGGGGGAAAAADARDERLLPVLRAVLVAGLFPKVKETPGVSK